MMKMMQKFKQLRIKCLISMATSCSLSLNLAFNST